MFSENSIIVQAWVRQIKQEVVTRGDVPNLSNLRDVVFSILDNEEVA